MSHRSAFGSIALVAVLAVVMPSLQGCLLAVAGAGAGAGYELTQDRSINDQIRDTAIGAAIAASWRQYEPKLAENCSATVYEGRVLLTGRVPNEEWRQIANKLVWQQKEVKQVYDEIQVGPGDDFTQRARDTLVTTKLKTSLLTDSAVRSANYSVTTVDNTVYLIGSARSQAELEAALNIARSLEGVRRVVSFVDLRGGAAPENRASASAPPPPPPPPNAAAEPPSAPPPPRQPVVQSTPLQ